MTKQKDSARKAIRDIRRVTRRQYSAEEQMAGQVSEGGEGLRTGSGTQGRNRTNDTWIFKRSD